MRRRAKLSAVAIAIGSVLSAVLVTTASAAPSAGAMEPNLHYAGANCKTIKSPQNWSARICVITNADDMAAEQEDQALVTFTIRSGSLAEISVNKIYLHACEGFCHNQYVKNYVVKFPSGRSSYISNPFAFDPDDTVQAVAVNPCVQWTNGQAACWSGTHKDETISTY